MSESLPEICISDFAEELLNSGEITNKATVSESGEAPSTDIPDISTIEVPDDFVEGLTGQKRIREEKKPVQKTSIREADIHQIVEGLAALTAQVKTLVNEMTTVGMLGVGPVKPLGKSKKKKKSAQQIVQDVINKRK